MDFEKMPDQARLWVYQADRRLTDTESEQLRKAADAFLSQWAAHGQELVSSFDVQYNQFLIIAVDESVHGASGCSIDASVGLVREAEKLMGVSFLDRSKVAILDDLKVILKPFTSLREEVKNGQITPQTKIFNNSVSSLGDWRKHWLQPAGESWLSRYF